MDKDVFAVILVGGKGKRLMPLSTDFRPKAFLSVTRDRKTMFANVLDRIDGLVDGKNTVVVANKAHARLVKTDFKGIRKKNLILEPVSRNTAPAIALAAKTLTSAHGDCVMMVLPSDQYICGIAKYREALSRCVEFVKRSDGVMVVMGVKPRSPSTQFGYIRVRGPASRGRGIYKVAEFAEKPDLKTAKKYIKSGRYLWNTGAFIFKASTILKAVKKLTPQIDKNLVRLDKRLSRYGDMPEISIDYAVMEKARNIYCAAGSYGWDDIGSFTSLASVLKRESRRFTMKDGKVASIL